MKSKYLFIWIEISPLRFASVEMTLVEFCPIQNDNKYLYFVVFRTGEIGQCGFVAKDI